MKDEPSPEANVESMGKYTNHRPEARAITTPDFLLIGTIKSGTTSLCKFLGRHSDI